MDWKIVDEKSFKRIKQDLFILKVMNTRCLITEPSNTLALDRRVQLYVHSLPAAHDAIVGYEIHLLHAFPLITASHDHLLLGSLNLKPCLFKKLFEDSHLKVFKTRNHDFLLCC